MSKELITLQTQEISLGLNPLALQVATDSLSKKVELVDVNLCFKNWDTSKIAEFPRAVYLGTDFMPCQDEKSGQEKLLETAFFMDEAKNMYYKAAYQFVKAVKRLPVGTNFSAKFAGTEKISNGNKAETFVIKQFTIKTK